MIRSKGKTSAQRVELLSLFFIKADDVVTCSVMAARVNVVKENRLEEPIR
jgi:hypothetical protein